jgi:chemotaxis family two-component system sensor kinase Cph1
MHRLNAVIRFLTAVISLLTVYFLIKNLPEAFRQKTGVELEREITRRQEAELSLETANKDLESFAYIASHDLQAPLRKILLYASMLHDRNESVFDAKSKDLTAKIMGSAERLKKLTDAVLQLSVLKEEAVLRPVLLREPLDLALEDLEVTIRDKGAIINISENLPLIMGNVSYLSQLFLNLIGNALKFCADIPVISISTTQGDGIFTVKVTDNGIGMTEAGRSKIFAPFSRLHNDDKYHGSGIGLAICKRIIEIHGGRISAESVPGQGSTFILELPVPVNEN